MLARIDMSCRLHLVVADVDGTLVDKSKNFSDASRKVIDFLHDNGIMFGIASGRPIDEVDHFDEKWGLGFKFDMIIGFNGGELRDNHNHTEKQYFPMKKEWIKEVVDNLIDKYGLFPWIYKDGKMLAMKESAGIRRTQSHNGKEIIFTDKREDLYQEDNPKVLVHIDPVLMPEIEADIATWIPSYYKAFKTQPMLLEFANTNVSKGAALEVFCKDNALDLEDVVSFGDASNDNELLKVSGWGVCLKNGLPDTKECADDITPYTNDEDGFARYMIETVFPKYGLKYED